jgi:hypothetical protein
MRLFIALLTFFSSITCASTVCEGIIEDYEVTRAGYLYMDTDYNEAATSQRLCNVSKEWSSVPPETCTSWLSIISTAAVTGAKVKLRYPNATGCTADDLGDGTNTVESPDYVRTFW